MTPEPIAGLADPRLADYRNIPDPELLERRGIFIAEGRLVVRRLLTTARFAARSVLVTPAAAAALADVLPGSGVPVYLLSQASMDEITGFNIHRGCLAVGERGMALAWQDLVSASAPGVPFVALERVANADNVGGLFRNAAAFDAAGVLLDGVSTDPLYRKAIRTSMGAALTVPFARLTPWLEGLDAIRASGMRVVGLSTAPGAAPLRACARQLARDRCLLLLGHEGEGLSKAALARCDVTARIPMSPHVDSLNVATAAAIALYELRYEAP